MSWCVTALDRRTVVDSSGSTLFLNAVPFTDDDGWIDVPLTPELRNSLSEHDVRASVVVRYEADGSLALCVDAIRFCGREFKSLHAFGFAHGPAWVRYVPEMIRQRVVAHCTIFPPTRTRRTTGGMTVRSSTLRGPTEPPP